MPNLSNATGTITITAENETIARTFFNAYDHIASNWDYGTYIDSNDQTIDRTDNQYSISASFTGAGRWAYSENIPWTFTIITDEKYHDKLIEEELTILKNSTISVLYDFEDFEAGQELLYTQTVKTTYNKGEITTEVLENTDLDYTLENLQTYISNDFYGTTTFIEDIKNNPQNILNNASTNLKEKLTPILTHPILTQELLTNIQENLTNDYPDWEREYWLDNWEDDIITLIPTK
ncbi:hypothetical protein [Alloscardovia criceti]|uniref:hypothetical protein n=1 Tax=Alloscardovia criceti TaxID=356828 RepID=UPI0003687174|nr:hypothetical protein [Alloscardovia criceti]